MGTAGPGSHAGNPDYEAGWKLANELGMPILDEHYYEQNDYFLNKRQYDNYPRGGKTKVYLGEYAAKDKKLICRAQCRCGQHDQLCSALCPQGWHPVES